MTKRKRTRPTATYGDFRQRVEAAGYTPRRCTDHHWQILGGRKLVNVWPLTHGTWKVFVDGQQGKATVAKLADALKAAGEPCKPEVPAPWEPEAETQPAAPEPHRGLIRRFCRWLIWWIW